MSELSSAYLPADVEAKWYAAWLFATPLANVSTNIKNVNANGSKVLGFFNVAAVSVAGKRFVE